MPKKKHLILTYGVSAGQQRTAVLPLARVNVLLTVVAGAVVWTVASVIYMATVMINDDEPTKVAAVEPQGLMTPEVALDATPLEPVKAEVAKAEVAKAEPIAPPPEQVALAVSPPVGETAAVAEASPTRAAEPAAPMTVAPSAKAAAMLDAWPPVAEPLPLAAALEGFHFARSGSKLVANFAIRNLSDEVLRGKVQGEADFVGDDGEAKTIVAELTYKARILSAKELRFVAPGPGKFVAVRITVRDHLAERALESKYEIGL